MKFISHRGNLNGVDKKNENNPFHVFGVSLKYDVEIDLWAKDNKLFLGHDSPMHEIQSNFFNKKMWIHCKNLNAVEYISKTKFHWFWHEKDKITMTSKGYIWCFPNVYLNNGITVMEKYTKDLPNIAGICTDFLKKYK